MEMELTEPSVRITLSYTEAENLKRLVQNSLTDDEPSEQTKLRHDIFNLLTKLGVK